MRESRRARSIPPGGTLGIAAPSGPVDPERLAVGAAGLRERGFEVVHSEDIVAQRGYLAGNDERRAQELMDLIRNPGIDGIICARGGYGCQRILPLLDPEVIRSEAKPLVGYSDVTALLSWQERCAGLVGLHGPMLERSEGLGSETLEALERALLGTDEGARLKGTGRVAGVADGPLRGGSLTMMVTSLGTPWEIETQNAIVLLEEVNEPPYRVDRMLQQLSTAGKLDGAAVGLGVGGLVGCEDRRYPRPDAEEVISEILEPLGLPMVTGLSFGHTDDNWTWPYGGLARIDGEGGEIVLVEASTERRAEEAAAAAGSESRARSGS